MSKEFVREAAALEHEFSKRGFCSEDQLTIECEITDYLQRPVKLYNRHFRDFQLWLEFAEDSVGTKLGSRKASCNFLHEQVTHYNKFLTSFQPKLVAEKQVAKPQVTI